LNFKRLLPFPPLSCNLLKYPLEEFVMRSIVYFFLLSFLFAMLAGCASADFANAPSVTPTGPEKRGLTATPTFTPTTETRQADPPTETPTPEPVALPVPFTIMLSFEADTVCGGAPFEFEYGVDVVDGIILLTQLNAGITTAGPYDAITGAFTASLSGLPGTETYSGTLLAASGAAGGTLVTMTGEYGYGGDANFCGGGTSSQLFAGTAEVP
jgi:hypothetical protein